MTALIAQISDIHAKPGAASLKALDRALDFLATVRPDALIVSGDLANKPHEQGYALVRDALARVACPVLMVPGNADRREAMRAGFPDAPWPKERTAPCGRDNRRRAADRARCDSAGREVRRGHARGHRIPDRCPRRVTRADLHAPASVPHAWRRPRRPDVPQCRAPASAARRDADARPGAASAATPIAPSRRSSAARSR